MMRLALVLACSVLVLQLTPRSAIASSDAEGPLSAESLVTPGSVTLNDPDPGNARRTFYDGLGRPVRTARANSYDRVGRLTRCDVFRAAGVFGTTLQTFEFDGLGRLTRSLDNNDPSTPDDDAVIELRYDSQSRVLEEELNGRVTAADWVADDRTGLRYPNGRRLQYAFDNLDRVKSIANAPASVQAGLIAPLPGGAPIAEFDYVGAGRLLECRLGNGTRRSYVDRATSRDTGYDALGRLVELDHLGASGQLLAGFSYTCNRTSHATSERRAHAPSTRAGDRVTYDSLYRIADHYRDVDAAELSAPQPARLPVSADEHRAYQLDGAGNWASLTITPQGGSAEVLAQGIGMMNEYTSFGPVQRVHDENGNTTDDGEHLLEYDFLNRLVGARDRGTGQRTARYAYDHLSRRTEREVTSSGALDEHVFYFYDGYRVIEEQDPAGTTTAQYVDGLGLDDHVSYSLNADLDASLETTYFHHADAKGWCAAITDAGGGVVERATYDPYGQAQLEDAASAPLPDQSRSAVGNPYLYGGLRLDPETGFLYARHRHYDPKTGRFLQRDPAGLWHDPMARGNAYLYAALSPWTYGDPMGTTAVPMQTLFTLMDAAWSARDLIGGKLGQVADVVGHFLWGVIQGGGIAWNDLSAAMGVLWGHPMDALDGMLRGAIDEVWNVLLASTGELQGMAQRAMPEISYLITNWDRLDTNDRARLVGKAMARHGAQLLGGGLAAMAAKKLAKKLAQKLLSNPPNAPAPHGGPPAGSVPVATGGEVALDTSALKGALERGRLGELDAQLAGRRPVVPPMAEIEFGVGGSPAQLQEFLAARGGRIGPIGTAPDMMRLMKDPNLTGKLKIKDAANAASAAREGLPLMTEDKKLLNRLRELGTPGERF